MNTLNRFREIAFGVALVVGLAAAALQPREGHTPFPASRPALEMCAATKGALCDGQFGIADLGSLTVTARRDTAVVAALGQMTVTARRDAVWVASAIDPVAYLGSITVSAPRFAAVRTSVAANFEHSVNL